MFFSQICPQNVNNFLTKCGHPFEGMIHHCFGDISKNSLDVFYAYVVRDILISFLKHFFSYTYSSFFTYLFFYLFEGMCSKIQVVSFCTRDDKLSIINELFNSQQDSFYHNLTEEELTRVHDYNFDHPG